MAIPPDDFKAVMRTWASGVTVVTTANGDTRAGTTASSFTSVSLEPTLILICLYHGVGAMKAIEENGHFAVSILGEEHAHVSSQMAGFTDIPEGKDRFHGLDWMTQETGSPILADANGWLDCKLHTIYEGGTHKIVLGEVIAAGRKNGENKPLLYFNSSYHQLHREQEQVEY